MAVFKAPKNQEKASSLDMPEVAKVKKEPRAKKKKEIKKSNAAVISKANLSLIADIALIIFIVGIVAGAYFGIRALQQAFAPVEEEREIIFCIAFPNVPQESVPTNDDGTFTMLKKE